MIKVEMVTELDIFEESMREMAQQHLVLDLGGRQRFHKQLAPFQELFTDVQYYCLDILPSSDLDVVGDLLQLPFATEIAGGVICHSVLEHVYEPHTAVREIYRVLKPGGIAFLYVPFLYPYHGTKGEPDCYRFTRDGVLYLFKDFAEIKLQPVDGYVGTLLRFMAGFTRLEKVTLSLERPLEWLVERLGGRQPRRGTQTTGYNIWVRK